jgi:hypothetical protein
MTDKTKRAIIGISVLLVGTIAIWKLGIIDKLVSYLTKTPLPSKDEEPAPMAPNIVVSEPDEDETWNFASVYIVGTALPNATSKSPIEYVRVKILDANDFTKSFMDRNLVPGQDSTNVLDSQGNFIFQVASPVLKTGDYTALVQAFDKAGVHNNLWRDFTMQVPSGSPPPGTDPTRLTSAEIQSLMDSYPALKSIITSIRNSYTDQTILSYYANGTFRTDIMSGNSALYGGSLGVTAVEQEAKDKLAKLGLTMTLVLT